MFIFIRVVSYFVAINNYSYKILRSFLLERQQCITVLSVKKSNSEKEEGIRRLLSNKEKIIKDEIASIDIKIKNNNDRIEFAKNKHLSLDYTYKTMKQDS